MRFEAFVNDRVLCMASPESAPTPGATSPTALPLDSDTCSAQLVELCTRFSADLFDWLDRTLPDEPMEHAVPLKRAVSNVAFALSERLLYPAYLQRPQLIPSALRSEL